MRLKARLQGILSPEELEGLVGAYDVVGDLAIIIVPDELVDRQQHIAEEILKSNRKLKVVAKRDGNYDGEFRTIPLKVLAGEERTETEVKEFGVRLLVNPGRVYYSVRTGNERRRIASLVKPGEAVLVLFSGISPFPLIISKFSKAKTIVGIEKNPQAHTYALENLRRNKKLKNIKLYLGDVREVLPSLSGSYDRVVMPLPTMAEEFLPWALQVLKPGGTLHFYDMQRPEQFEQSGEKVALAAAAVNRKILSSAITKCGHCAPKVFRICLDAEVS